MNREVTSEKVKQTMRGTKTAEENCGNCSCREGWFCYVAGDYVKRERDTAPNMNGKENRCAAVLTQQHT